MISLLGGSQKWFPFFLSYRERNGDSERGVLAVGCRGRIEARGSK